MIDALYNLKGVSGAEDEIRMYLLNELSGLCDDIRVDNMGNIIAKRIYNDKLPTTALIAHIDEPGFIITDITEDGYLKFETIGDIKTDGLLAEKVKIGDIIGIISLKAIHLSTKEEREKKVKIDDLYIDIGASDKIDAEKYVGIGDYCAFYSDTVNFGDGLLKGCAVAARAECLLLLNLLKSGLMFNTNLLLIFTVQHNVKCRGIMVLTDELNSVEQIFVLGETDIKENKLKLGNGTIIEETTDDNERTEELCKSIIQKIGGIPYQQYVSKLKNEKKFLSQNFCDKAILTIGIPCEYKNSSVNLISEKDIRSTQKIIEKILSEVI